MMHSLYVLYPLLGLFAGLMAGLFGVGGGVIVVPGLVFLFQSQGGINPDLLMQTAIGTSLAAMIITSLASVTAHYRLGNLSLGLFDRLWPGLIVGAFFGACLSAKIPTQWLEIFFGLFLVAVALKMFFAKTPTGQKNFPATGLNHAMTFFIGASSGLLGIGGGILMVPYLSYCGIELRKISPVANLAALCIAFIGTLVYSYAGSVNWAAVFLIGLFSSLAAPLGAYLSTRLPITYLNYGFILLLLLTALKMLF